MQELLELCKHYQATFQNPIGEIVKKIESELLEKEKEQIIDARVDGDTWSTAIKEMRTEYAEQYYNETFNTNDK